MIAPAAFEPTSPPPILFAPLSVIVLFEAVVWPVTPVICPLLFPASPPAVALVPVIAVLVTLEFWTMRAVIAADEAAQDDVLANRAGAEDRAVHGLKPRSNLRFQPPVSPAMPPKTAATFPLVLSC